LSHEGKAVLIAFFADVHANRPVFEACLAQARELGAVRIVLLGDYVGYGADPEWTVTTVMDLVDRGALAVRGNHDSAVGNPREDLNAEAHVAIEWTRGALGLSERRFLAGLPLTLEDEDRLYVHADASRPRSWN
jgi:predicted phosphodiesterase